MAQHILNAIPFTIRLLNFKGIIINQFKNSKLIFYIIVDNDAIQ